MKKDQPIDSLHFTRSGAVLGLVSYIVLAIIVAAVFV